MRSGFKVCSPNNEADPVPKATAPAAETLMKWRRVCMFGYSSVIPSEVEESLFV